MNRIKILMVVGIVCALALCTAPTSAIAAAKVIPWYTPPSGGAGYMLGAGLASVTKKYLQDVEVVVEPTKGTLEMVRLLKEREGMKREAFAQIGSPDAYDAYKGQKGFAGKPYPTIRAVTFLHGGDAPLVVLRNSSIKSYADLKGKRVGIGGAGSSVALMSFACLEAHGVKREDFKPYYYSYKESADGITDKSLDAGFMPVLSFAELSLTQDVRMVPMDEPVAKKIVTEHPYYYIDVVKAKAYKGIEQDTPIMLFAVNLFTHAGVSEDLTYRILKNLYEHLPEFHAVHRAARDATLQNALRGVVVPLHPGAEKYYKEVGVIKK
jgi:TRAP transporter TAXI family solute receptor